jgi:CHAT domain-containing protein/tetratricopeptide (TPR) repeat protein
MHAGWQIAKSLFLLVILLWLGRDHPCCNCLWRFQQSYALPADILDVVNMSTEGRLAGEQIRPSEREKSLSSSQKKLVRILARQLQKDDSAQSHLDLAKLALASGDTDRAVLMLKYALARKPRKAQIYNDLAVAYVAHRDSVLDLAMALELLNKALLLDHGFLEARFNRALVLEKLRLPREAIKAWNLYLRIDSSSAWSFEARGHISNLNDLLSDKWQNTRHLLWSSLEDRGAGRFYEAAEDFSQEARTYGEEDLLSDWAVNALSGRAEDASRCLGMARKLGEALASATREQMLRDAVGVIDQEASRNSNSGKFKLLLKGHSQFRVGLNFYYGRNSDRAIAAFKQSVDSLRKAGSPFQYWASFFLVLCEYYASGNYSVEASLKLLREELAKTPYQSLVGRIDWMLGLVAYERGDLGIAIVNLNSAREIFEKAGESENRAAIYNILANCLSQLGEQQSAWGMRSLALAHIESLRSAQRLHNIYGQTAAALANVGYVRVGLAFQNEVIDVVDNGADPLLKSIGHLQRANILSGMGQFRHAVEDLGIARLNLRNVPSKSQQTGVETDIILAESKAWINKPEKSVRLLSDAIEEYSRTNYRFRLVDLYYQRASLYQDSCGTAAESDRDAALNELARQAKSTVSSMQRGLLMETGRAIYDDQISCLADKGDYTSSLAYSEQARGFWSDGAKDTKFELAQVRNSLPSGTLVIEYSVKNSRIIVWVISRQRFSGISIDADEKFFGDIRNFLRLLASGSWSDSLSELLFDTLVAHFREDVFSASKIIFVPDKILWDIPFSALRDKNNGEFLLERHEVVVSPSLTWYISKKDFHYNRKLPKVLAVGNPTLSRMLFPALEQLPQAAEEVDSVKLLYPSAVIRKGSEATKGQFIEGLKKYDVVIFAGHALDDRERPWRSALLFAPDPINEDVGILYAQDISKQRIRSRLVVLSACTTIGGGSQTFRAISGWGQALLAGGVENVVVSYWPVSDNGSRKLLTAFQRAIQRGAAVGEALRSAQLSLCGKKCTPSKSVDWVAFGVFGL